MFLFVESLRDHAIVSMSTLAAKCSDKYKKAKMKLWTSFTLYRPTGGAGGRREIQEEGVICKRTADSLHCTAETTL